MNEPTHLDLFSGIGGFALAAKWAGFRTIGFCEIDPYCQKVLAKNFPYTFTSGLQGSQRQGETGAQGTSNGHALQCCPIIPNIFDLDGRQFAGVDLITGGFPCQPFSVAGKRRGAADDRALWPEMFRVIGEARPAWVLGENVPGIIPMELDNVLSDLEGIGYATRTFVIPACAVDARHRRDRVWIIGGNISDTEGTELTSQRGSTRQWRAESGCCCRWLPEPAVCGVADGLPDGLVRYAGRVAKKIPNRVQKLKALGNSIVPQLAYEILREIRKLM